MKKIISLLKNAWQLIFGQWPLSWDAYFDEDDAPEPVYEDFDEDEAIEEKWLCSCGHMEYSPFHCTVCGEEPPWGCDCGACVDEADEWDEDYDDVLLYDEPGLLAQSFDFADGDDEDEDNDWPY